LQPVSLLYCPTSYIRTHAWTRIPLSILAHWPICFPYSLAKLFRTKT
jgi:hypothetical protein